jgi:4-hydroxy-tetrahydrodipicolinate synthase
MFKGCIVALVTPMLDDGSVDFLSLGALVEYHIDSGTDSIVVIGTTGESVTLSFTEHQEVVRYVVEKVGQRIPVIVGNGSNNTAQTVARTKVLDKLGIDGFLTVVPYYNRPCQRGLIAHFTAVAAATLKPVLLYNVPGRTVTDLLPETVMVLAKINNVVGIKEATGNLERLTELKALCCSEAARCYSGGEFVLLSGDDTSAFEFICQGGDGVISVTANVAAKEMSTLCQLALTGHIDEARALNDKLALLHKRLFIAPSPAPTKWVLQHCGRITTAAVRLPLISIESVHHNDLKEALKVAGCW